MKKLVILGCENSHADGFLDLIAKNPEFSDIQVVGVYSEDIAAAEKLKAKFGVPVMANYAEAVGKVDGVINTARHGDNHYKYCKPYIASGIPMFIDKPYTVSEADAMAFTRELKENNVKITGGSSLRFAFGIQTLKLAEEKQVGGSTVGGIIRAPLSSVNAYGGFFFYSQHLVEMVCAVFGSYPKGVSVAFDANQNRTVLFYYDSFIITGLFSEGSYKYYAARFATGDSQGGVVQDTGMKEWQFGELKEYVDVLRGGQQPMSYKEMMAPVFILNAIDRASASGKLEPITYGEV